MLRCCRCIGPGPYVKYEESERIVGRDDRPEKRRRVCTVRGRGESEKRGQ